MRENKVHVGGSAADEPAQIEPWTIDVELGLLRDGSGVEKRLEPRLSKLMQVLLDHAGRFVSRRELIDEVWANAVVTEQSLTRAVADLRKFLRSNYSVPPVIDTASKQGYRLSYPTQTQGSGRAALWRVAKRVAYGVGAMVLIVLVLRGLNY